MNKSAKKMNKSAKWQIPVFLPTEMNTFFYRQKVKDEPTRKQYTLALNKLNSSMNTLLYKKIAQNTICKTSYFVAQF